MILISLLMGILTFLGLWIVSINMENITQREGQDFIFFGAKSEDAWELRLLGTSLVINKGEINAKLRHVSTRITHYVSGVGSTLEEITDFLQQRLLWLKNGQDGGYPIK
jgi:hypothetical protein